MQPIQDIKDAIKTVITDLMDRFMGKVLAQDPFIVEKHHSTKPLYAARRILEK